MRRWRLTGASLALLAMAAGTADAHPARRGLPVPQQQQQRPHLVIVETGGGFVIRCEAPRGPLDTHFPQGAILLGAIPLGTSVRIDRAALQPPNQKDIDHGQIR